MASMAKYGMAMNNNGFSFFVGLIFVVYAIGIFIYTLPRVSVYYNQNLFKRMLNDYKAKVYDFNKNK